MSRQNLIRFNVGGRDPLTPFTVKVGGTFTIPTTKTQASVVDPAFGGNLLGSIVSVVGGQLLLASSDGASGTGSAFDLTSQEICDLRPGDIVAMSAVVGGVATVTATSVDGTVRTFLLTTTTTGTVVGYFA